MRKLFTGWVWRDRAN